MRFGCGCSGLAGGLLGCRRASALFLGCGSHRSLAFFLDILFVFGGGGRSLGRLHIVFIVFLFFFFLRGGCGSFLGGLFGLGLAPALALGLGLGRILSLGDCLLVKDVKHQIFGFYRIHFLNTHRLGKLLELSLAHCVQFIDVVHIYYVRLLIFSFFDARVMIL